MSIDVVRLENEKADYYGCAMSLTAHGNVSIGNMIIF